MALRKHYQQGSYVYHQGLDKRILFKKLKLTVLAPICKEINPIGQFRLLDYVLHLDASCLNDNWADRNVVSWFSSMEMIKRVSSLTHNEQEKSWTWHLEEPKINPKEWARGLKFFSEFKKWALSFNHDAMHKLICTMEAKINSQARLPL
jgi:hypothetical protein